MLQRLAQTLATSAALAALLVGLARSWDFWTVAKRATGGYFAIYIVSALLLALGRTALMREPSKAAGTTGNAAEPRGTDGTDAAR